MFLPIENTPRDYAWGAIDLIAKFRQTAQTGLPEAELWFGTHPGSPARLTVPRGNNLTLADFVTANPELALGVGVQNKEKTGLPFLFKLLAAARPLSLQAHPTAAQAREGFDRENISGIPLGESTRNYKDALPKPELIVAVSERFEALSGFRPLDEVADIRALLEKLSDVCAGRSSLNPLLETLGGANPFEASLRLLLSSENLASTRQLIDVVAEVALNPVALASPYRASFETVTDLYAEYPGDSGVVISLLLNRVSLRRGECLYLAAGNIHAYLEGFGVELMTASDNVLRGGLTAKHVDVPELVRVLDFSPVPPPRLLPREVSPGVLVYRPADHFADPGFELLILGEGGVVALNRPAIVVAETAAELIGSSGNVEYLNAGGACFITADEYQLTVKSDVGANAPARVYVATTSSQEHSGSVLLGGESF